MIGDTDEAAGVRPAAGRLLGICPDQMSVLIDTLTEVAKAEGPTFNFVPQLRLLLGDEMRRIEFDALPTPPWVQKAAGLGLMLLRDHRQAIAHRRNAVSLYAAAAGQAAAPTLEALVWDEKLPSQVRSAVVSELLKVNPESEVFVELAKRYDSLPRDLARALGGPAARAKEAPGAEAFVIRFLKDKKLIGGSRVFVVGQLRLPLTKALRTALEELEKHPVIGVQARAAIQRLENMN